MSIFNASMLKSLLPIIEGQLTDEKVAEVFDQIANSYPIEDGETRNIIILSQTAGKVNFSVCGLKKDSNVYIISKPKMQTSLVEGIKLLLNKYLK